MLQTPTEYWGSIQFRRNNFENVDRVLRQNKRNFRKYVQYICWVTSAQSWHEEPSFIIFSLSDDNNPSTSPPRLDPRPNTGRSHPIPRYPLRLNPTNVSPDQPPYPPYQAPPLHKIHTMRHNMVQRVYNPSMERRWIPRRINSLIRVSRNSLNRRIVSS